MPASGASARATESGPTQVVELVLAPRDAEALHQLAENADTIPLAVRQARLPEVLAGTERAATVADRARALGFDVTATTTTSVTLTGPAALVLASFGSARNQRTDSEVGQALPTTPTEFQGLVTVAAGGDETRPVRQPQETVLGPQVISAGAMNQADLRQLYSIPGTSTTPTGNSPTIATLQFSNWTPSDLTLYAQSEGVYGNTSYDPITGGGFSPVTVGTGPGNSPINSANNQGPGEVSLDQSALATVAPQFRQRAYFAPNTVAGQAQALNQIATEAAAQKIVAVSTSWGICESDIYPSAAHGGAPDSNLIADQQAIDAAVAAGVTIFAASGDHGVFDCGDGTTISVDTPASFPEVIAVGGTSVTKPGYGERAWGPGGGGYSKVFCASPAQVAALPTAAGDATCASGRARGVPDIAMDADPASGLTIYINGVHDTYGGTSLSAPLAAGALAATLLAAGTQPGAHDVQSWLYSAQYTAAMPDITTGTEGSTRAGGGWDPITGVGSPRWSTLKNRATPSPILLAGGSSLVSANGRYQANMQGDGNFVVYGPSGVIWHAGTYGHPGAALAVQGDGNLVIYANSQPIWNSGTFNHPGGSVLVLRDDGTLALLQDGQALWQVTDRASAPSVLTPDQALVSPNGHRVVMQSDGNLVVYAADGRALWSSQTWGHPGAIFANQGDGNLVVYALNGQPLWWSGTNGTGAGNLLFIQVDGNLVLYHGNHPVWSSQTRG